MTVLGEAPELATHAEPDYGYCTPPRNDASVVHHVAGPGGGAQRGAHLVGVGAGLGGGAGTHRAHVADDTADDDVRLAATEDRRVLRLHLAITRERLGLGRTAGDLGAPSRH